MPRSVNRHEANTRPPEINTGKISSGHIVAGNRARDRERRSETPDQSTGQLLWLVFAVVVAGAPHLLHLHPWVPVIVLGIIGWRLIAAVQRWQLPNLWLRVPLTLFGFMAVMFSYRQVTGLAAGSALLLVMVAMKLLETRGHRDRAVVIFHLLFPVVRRVPARTGNLVLGLPAGRCFRDDGRAVPDRTHR